MTGAGNESSPSSPTARNYLSRKARKQRENWSGNCSHGYWAQSVLSQDTSSHPPDPCLTASHICKLVLFRSGTPALTYVECGCSVSSLPATERNPLSASRKTGLWNREHVPRRWPWVPEKKKVITLNEVAYILMSASFPFKAGCPVYRTIL